MWYSKRGPLGSRHQIFIPVILVTGRTLVLQKNDPYFLRVSKMSNKTKQKRPRKKKEIEIANLTTIQVLCQVGASQRPPLRSAYSIRTSHYVKWWGNLPKPTFRSLYLSLTAAMEPQHGSDPILIRTMKAFFWCIQTGKAGLWTLSISPLRQGYTT